MRYALYFFGGKFVVGERGQFCGRHPTPGQCRYIARHTAPGAYAIVDMRTNGYEPFEVVNRFEIVTLAAA